MLPNNTRAILRQFRMLCCVMDASLPITINVKKLAFLGSEIKAKVKGNYCIQTSSKKIVCFCTVLFVCSFQCLIAGARNPIMIRVPGYTPGQPVPQHAFPKPPTLDDWNLHNQKILSGRSGRPTGATVIEKRIIQVGWFL